MKRPPTLSWYEGWKGNKKYLPWSGRQGVELARNTLIPLQAQIAYYFGDKEGSLKSLKEGAHKLSKGEPIICESCQRNIWKEPHRAVCEIALQYTEVITTKPGEIHKVY